MFQMIAPFVSRNYLQIYFQTLVADWSDTQFS